MTARRRENLGGSLAGALAFLLLAALLLFATTDVDDVLRRHAPGSTRSADPDGTARLHAGLARLGAPAARLAAGDAVPPGATVLVVAPGAPLAPAAAEDLCAAVAGGASLVAAGRREELEHLPDPLRPPDLASVHLVTGPIEIVAPLPWRPDRAATSAAPEGGAPAAAPVQAFASAPAGAAVLARAGAAERPVLVMLRYGKGRVILCSEPKVFQNGWLHLADNVELVLGLLCGRERVLFDDRWAARSDARADAMALVYGTPGGRAATLAVLALLLTLWLWGLFPGGPSRRGRDGVRLSHYVDALAELTIATARPSELLEPFRETFLHEARLRLGQPPGTPADELAPLLAERLGADAGRVLELLSGRPPRRDVVTFVRELDALREAL